MSTAAWLAAAELMLTLTVCGFAVVTLPARPSLGSTWNDVQLAPALLLTQIKQESLNSLNFSWKESFTEVWAAQLITGDCSHPPGGQPQTVPRESESKIIH